MSSSRSAAGLRPAPLPAPKIRVGNSRDKRTKGLRITAPSDAPMRIVHTGSIVHETRPKCGIKSGCYQLVTDGDSDFSRTVSNHNWLALRLIYRQLDRVVGNVEPRPVHFQVLHRVIHRRRGYRLGGLQSSCARRVFGEAAQKSSDLLPAPSSGASVRAAISAPTLGTARNRPRVLGAAKPCSTICSRRLRNVAQ